MENKLFIFNGYFVFFIDHFFERWINLNSIVNIFNMNMFSILLATDENNKPLIDRKNKVRIFNDYYINMNGLYKLIQKKILNGENIASPLLFYSIMNNIIITE